MDSQRKAWDQIGQMTCAEVTSSRFNATSYTFILTTEGFKVVFHSVFALRLVYTPISPAMRVVLAVCFRSKLIDLVKVIPTIRSRLTPVNLVSVFLPLPLPLHLAKSAISTLDS